MKKQIGDLTLREIKQYCKFNTYGLVAGLCDYCEFHNICHTKIAMLLSEHILEQEIEVKEDEQRIRSIKRTKALERNK